MPLIHIATSITTPEAVAVCLSNIKAEGVKCLENFENKGRRLEPSVCCWVSDFWRWTTKEEVMGGKAGSAPADW